MSLHEAASGKRLSATKLESGTHIRNAREKLHKKTFDKVCNTIDEAIEDVVSGRSPKFVWMNTGSLVGDYAGLPKASHQHLWEAVYNLFPSSSDPVAEKERLVTVGSLIKWRTALRDEPWLVHYRDTDKRDIVTGDPIRASEYWIKPSGVALRKPNPKEASVWGRGIGWMSPTQGTTC